MVEDTRSFKERVAFVQKELKAPKGKYNSFGKYHYRSAEDILEAAKPLCVDNDLMLTITDEPVMVGDWHYIRATARIDDVRSDDPLHFAEVSAFARESTEKKGQDLSQITGTASSYARKYALNGLFLIDDTKDADTDEYHQQTSVSAPQSVSNAQSSNSSQTNAEPLREAGSEQITAQEARILAGMLTPAKETWILSHYKVESIEKLTKVAYVELVNTLKQREEAKAKA